MLESPLLLQAITSCSNSFGFFVSMITDYHAKYYGYELTKRCPSDSLEKLACAVASAQVDLNPHQVDVALFALRTPLSKGELPPAEVGFDYSAHEGKVTILQPLLNSAGWLTFSLLNIEALDQGEDYLIFSAVTDAG